MIRIQAAHLAEIGAQAEAAYPKECCGLLVGRDTGDGSGLTIERVVPSPNLAAGEARDRFLVDPKVQFELMRDLADRPERIVGSYHSHPDHPPEPSATDLELAYYPDFVSLITAVTDGAAGETRAFRLSTERRGFEPVALTTD